MDPRMMQLATEYSKLTASIYMIRNLGHDYSKEENKARTMLEEIRDMGFVQIGMLEDKLEWALRGPPPSS